MNAREKIEMVVLAHMEGSYRFSTTDEKNEA